jgi:hypothetical protein
LHKANLVIWNAVYDVSISTVLASRMKELPFNFQKMEGKKKKTHSTHAWNLTSEK